MPDRPTRAIFGRDAYYLSRNLAFFIDPTEPLARCQFFYKARASPIQLHGRSEESKCKTSDCDCR
jgi:hypothetical protein